MSRQNLIVFFLLASIGFFAYKNCLDIFIPGDNYSQLYFFEKGFFTGFSEFSRFAAPYFIGYPLLYFLYQLFDISSCWMPASILLHVLNAFLVFLIAGQLARIFFHKHETAVAFFSALVFLISPYQTEEVIWVPIIIRGLFHTLVTLSGIYIFILHLKDPSAKRAALIHFLFLLGIFSYELSLVVPLAYTALYLLYRATDKTSVSLKHFLARTLSVQLVLIVAYFLACKIWSGHWLWHGGTAEGITQSTDLAKTLLKYFAKFFLFYRYLPVQSMDIFLRTLSGNHFLSASLLIATASVFILFLTRTIKKNKETGSLLAALLACFIIFLLPVLPLDSSFLSYIYPDRYGYMPSAFFYTFLVFLIFFLLEKLTVPVLIGYCVLSWMLLMQTIPVWNSSNEYCNTLIENYKPFLKYDRVYILNMPSFYKGVAAFRSSFPEAIFIKYDRFPAEKIRVISGEYQESFEDTLISVKISGNTVKVIGPPKKTPHFCIDGWPTSREKKEYKLDFDSTGCSYLLTFKQDLPPNSAILYTVNGTWKKAE